MSSAVGFTKVVRAFAERKPLKIKNDVSDGEKLTFHGNTIAWWHNENVYVTLAGYNTVTTRLRLNIISDVLGLGLRFSQHKHEPYCNGVEISSRDVFTYPNGWRVAA